MKPIFTCLALLLLFNTGYSQYCGTSGPTNCIPVGNPTQRGFYPSTAEWPAIVNGAVTGGVVGFKNWDTVNYQGSAVTVDSMQINSVTNLPNGICWSTGSATNMWGNSQYGCVMLSGTACAAPGQYKLNIIVNVFTSLGEAQQNLDDDSVFCFIRVVNSGETVPAVDTTQRGTPNAFIAYGPTSPCAATNPWLSPNVYDTVCANSTVILTPVVSGDSQLLNNFFTYQWIATGDTLSCTTCLTPKATITQNSQFVLVVTDIMGNVGLDTFTYTLNGSTNNMSVSFTNNNLACSNSVDTSTISITGGTSPFSINRGDGSSTQTGQGANTGYSYGHTGPYQVIVTDASNCISTVYDTIKLNSPIAVSLNVTAQPTCAVTNAGAITALAAGGTPAYTYSWSTGAVTSSVASLTTGTYTITITDALYCTASASAYLAPFSTMYGYYVFLNETDANCSNTGSVQPFVFGGTAPYTYAWSNGASSQNITGLAPGAYSVTVTDQGSCTVTGNTTVNAVCVGAITGHVYSDTTGTCLVDSTAPGIAGAYISATSLSTQNVYYAVTDTTGFYTINAYDSGTYIIRAISSGSFFCNINSCTDSAVTSVAAGVTSNYNNLAMQPPTGGFDLSIYPTWTAGNPGFTKQYAIYYENNSLTPYAGQAAITFVYDPGLVYQYSSGPQPAVDAANHTLTWALNGVSLSLSQVLTSYFLVPTTMSTGYVLQGSINITPYAGDCDTANNYFAISDVVTGSFDPNEKDVSPANTLAAEDSVLTYTIHFQNTGTDSTHFIIVKDTLSQNLNPLTVHTVASSSRNYKFNITGTGILTWTFNPYSLCDSATNPGGSKGFVSFTVNKKQGIPYGSVISNTASVYFDYNAPVITNTVKDTLAQPTGITPVVSKSTVTVRAYPVPFNDETNIVVNGLNQTYTFELYDLTGRLLRSIPSINTAQFVFRRNGMAAGVYMYRILSGTGIDGGLSQVAVGRLVVE
jgi:uncharacterized repeat protein (TIGR01451 family)